MSRRANPAVVGGFVVGALVLTVVGVLVFGGGALLRERYPVVAFFSGNVRGLQVGSAVEFRGVRVGTVTSIRLVVDADSNDLLIPVYMDLEPRSLTLLGSSSSEPLPGMRAFLDDLVAQGLRARLDLKSFVTGQRAVGLDMSPEERAVRIGVIAGVYELPTVASTLDRFTQELQGLPLQEMAEKLIATLNSVEQVMTDEHLGAALRDAAGAAADTRKLMAQLQSDIGPTLRETRETLREARGTLADIGARTDATLEDYASLARDARARLGTLAAQLDRTLDELAGIRGSLDARLAPVTDSAVGALEETRAAMGNARELLAEDSRTRYNLDVTLEELAAAARSLRIMVDYLEQNPDALIKGKGL